MPSGAQWPRSRGHAVSGGREGDRGAETPPWLPRPSSSSSTRRRRLLLTTETPDSPPLLITTMLRGFLSRSTMTVRTPLSLLSPALPPALVSRAFFHSYANGMETKKGKREVDTSELAVVTGGGSGIGQALTLRLARRGMRVVAKHNAFLMELCLTGVVTQVLIIGRQEQYLKGTQEMTVKENLKVCVFPKL